MALNNGFEYREQIDNRGSGLTVLAYLARKYRHSTEAAWLDRLDAGEVSVSVRTCSADDVLKAGQWLVWRRPPWDEPDVPLTYSLLHEDEDLLAVAKPRGLPTVPAGGFLENTLFSLVRREYPTVTPIHRLGRGTSGIVLFARSARARSVLCDALRRNELTRVYRALASGIPTLDHFDIDAPIGPVSHSKIETVHAASPNGKRALSWVRVLGHREGNSLVEVAIETGRPHQIRIHLAFAGYPLVGDPLYAVGGGIKNPRALPGDLGYLLHAESLCFCHPATGLLCNISCLPPPELRKSSEA